MDSFYMNYPQTTDVSPFPLSRIIHPRMKARIKAYRERTLPLKRQAEARKVMRQQSIYQDALERISTEMSDPGE